MLKSPFETSKNKMLLIKTRNTTIVVYLGFQVGPHDNVVFQAITLWDNPLTCISCCTSSIATTNPKNKFIIKTNKEAKTWAIFIVKIIGFDASIFYVKT